MEESFGGRGQLGPTPALNQEGLITINICYSQWRQRPD